MDDAIYTSETPRGNQPVQYSEPMPEWVHDELNAHREKLPELRAALCEAIKNSKGVLAKGEKNKDQGYAYTGFSDILEAVREPMAAAGINIEQVSCDLEGELGWSNKYGQTTCWKWRAVYLITHTSGCSVARIVRTMTSPGAKAAMIASSSCDRLLTTRLMRLAGGKDETTPDGNDRDNRGWNTDAARPPEQRRNERPVRQNQPGNGKPAGAAAQGAQSSAPTTQQNQQPQQQELGAAAPATTGKTQHREFTEADRQRGKDLIDRLEKAVEQTQQRARLIVWGRILRSEARGLPRTELDRGWAAIYARCAKLEILPGDLSNDLKKQGEPLPFEYVVIEPETGDMHDKRDGTLL